MIRLVRRRLRWTRRASDILPEIVSSPWRTFPFSTVADGHLFAVGDLHGCASLLEPLLDHLAVQPSFEHAPRTIVFLGDLIDRGPHSIRCLHLAQSCAGRFDGSVILPGNHEGVLLRALEGPCSETTFQRWLNKGGGAVVKELGAQRLPLPEQREAVRQALPHGLLDRLRQAPSHHRSGDLLLVHAGIAPTGDRTAFLAQALGAATARRAHWSTIREPFLSWRSGWDGDLAPGSTLVVHGHSPALRWGWTGLDGIIARADLSASHRRINLDLGSTRSGLIGALEALGRRYRIHLARRS